MSSPNPFDLGDDPSPSTPGRPDANPFLDPAEPRRRTSRIGWFALIIAVGVSLLIGVAGYARAAAYAEGYNVDTGVRGIALTVLSLAGGLAAVVVAVIAVIRSAGNRLVAVIALLVAVILPWIALWLGTSLGPHP